MNTDPTHPALSAEPAKQFVTETVQQASDAVKQATEAVKSAGQGAAETARDAGQRAGEAMKDAGQAVRARAETALAQTEDAVREFPLTAVLGAFALGGLAGYLLAVSNREEMSFRARLAQAPVDTLRAAVAEAMAPYARQMRSGYGHARESASDALDHLQDSAEHHRGTIGKAIHRFGDNLKFW